MTSTHSPPGKDESPTAATVRALGEYGKSTSIQFSSAVATWKAFSTLQARLALQGFCLEAHELENVRVIFVVRHLGVAQELDSMADVDAFVAARERENGHAQ